MKVEQIGAQLYTLREFLKTPEDIRESLKKVADIGYKTVQVSGMGPIDEADLVQMCEDNGLSICATHEGSDTILNEPEEVVERLKKLNCLHTAYPYPREIDFGSEESVATLIAKLNAAGKVLADAGQTLSYHNHGIEFRKLNGKVILERIYEETDPAFLKAELDTYWVQVGGANPTEWVSMFPGRQPLIHLKDYTINAENQPFFAPIGDGNLNWKALIAEGEKAGIEYYIVEQDRCDGSPFDALARSFNYLSSTFC